MSRQTFVGKVISLLFNMLSRLVITFLPRSVFWFHGCNLISMKKQKVMSQMKGQDKTPEKQLSEVEIGNHPEKEIRIMIVKVIQDPGKEWKQRLRRCQKCLLKT